MGFIFAVPFLFNLGLTHRQQERREVACFVQNQFRVHVPTVCLFIHVTTESLDSMEIYTKPCPWSTTRNFNCLPSVILTQEQGEQLTRTRQNFTKYVV